MTTTVALPDDYTFRPPEPNDAEAIVDLLSAYNLAMIGFADCTLDGVTAFLAEPGFDRGTDSWLVLAGNGLPIGLAASFGLGDRQVVQIDLTSQEPAVAAWLFERATSRAREMGHERGHAEVTVDFFIFRADEPLRALLSDRGCAFGTTYHRMRIDHTADVAVPGVPEGVVVRRGAFDDAARSAAQKVVNESFRGQFGFVPRPHDEWVEALEALPTFDWSQLTVLEVDGRAVAVRQCNDGFVEEENCGHIAMLGVLEEFRGRGLAKFLLRDAFALDTAAGRAGTMLHVDTNNPTPALGLYLSVGMNPILVMDGLRCVLPTARVGS
ncbi:GNAT family N-acetyltransferase [Kribbella monticola]|uniref:GNAT family N-acetyltransferase n=1 Tax=Kribbella monticola TaxID=2185285 RepID=UPI000DD44191|nr:GNAT family N-acetyltransferase [Kribbella monticola]